MAASPPSAPPAIFPPSFAWALRHLPGLPGLPILILTGLLGVALGVALLMTLRFGGRLVAIPPHTLGESAFRQGRPFSTWETQAGTKCQILSTRVSGSRGEPVAPKNPTTARRTPTLSWRTPRARRSPLRAERARTQIRQPAKTPPQDAKRPPARPSRFQRCSGTTRARPESR